MTSIHHFTLDAQLTQKQISAFRGAVINMMGKQAHPLMHNHFDNGLRYAYPLVQYKIINGHPTMVAIGDVANYIYNYFKDIDELELLIGKRRIICHLSDYSRFNYNPIVDDTPRLYSISNYIPLTEDNVIKFDTLMALTDKINLIEQIITGNILSFFKGINHHTDQQITCVVESIQKQQFMTYKKVRFKTFHLQFISNVLLPDIVGLGKSTSIGMGVIHQLPFPEKYSLYLSHNNNNSML